MVTGGTPDYRENLPEGHRIETGLGTVLGTWGPVSVIEFVSELDENGNLVRQWWDGELVEFEPYGGQE